MLNEKRLSSIEWNNQQSADEPNTRHISYLDHQHQLELTRSIYFGIDTAKQHIFKFPQEIQETYNIRIERATLRNFCKRAVEAFTGMIFRKPIEIENYGARTTALFPKIDTRQSIQQFAKECTEFATLDGEVFILIDSSSDGESAPYFVMVYRHQLINWRVNANGLYTMIVIEETIAIPKGKFGTEYVLQWRHYDEEGNVSIYRNTTVNNITEIRQIGPTIETGYDGIPLVAIKVDETPILYDTAKLNIKHMNRLSHKDRYLTMAALPIPVIWGADIDDDTQTTTTAKPAMVIGVDEAFLFSSKEDGDFQWRELSGSSIQELEKDLDSITEDITTGILRAADSANSVQKTATEVALLQAEASDRVSAIAIAVQTGIQAALVILAEFNTEKVPDSAMFKLSTDFTAALSGTDGQRLVYEAYLQGLISIDTFLQSLADAEIISIESTQKEIEKIKSDNFKPEPKIAEPAQVDNRTKSAMDAGEKPKAKKE
ncbi:MAG: DUF4055 domain-containing protein [Deltaproteobacteria bacterium]|nr:DUF4055 domain-containing protein [Candidatus Tharpellaceae bacterium]